MHITDQPITRESITRDLRTHLGISAGDILAVHSSLKSLGQVDGGAGTLIAALLDAVGGPAQGTVLMPCFNEPDDRVDLRTTPCRLGAVPEAFRTTPGVIRSEHPTHSVAVAGRHAATLAAAHRGTAPLGVGSPFHMLSEMGGCVLHIGCEMKSCSLIHVAEALANLSFHHIAYPAYDKTIQLVLQDGTCRRCPPSIDSPGCSSAFLKVQAELERQGKLRRGKVGQAACLKAKASDILATALLMLRRDPGCLLCDKPACQVCTRKRAVLAGFSNPVMTPCAMTA